MRGNFVDVNSFIRPDLGYAHERDADGTRCSLDSLIPMIPII